MAGKVFLIQSEGLGTGDDKLGFLLMANFLRLLGESEHKPAALIFWNAGVRLVCEGSPVLNHVRRLDERGVAILACTTCIEYFGLEGRIAVGKPTTMARSIESMFGSDIVSL
jgi:selenium metabolism protein YedF